MLQHMYPLQQIINRHFFVSLMDDRNLITQLVKALFFCKHAIVFRHCFIKIVDICLYLIFFTQSFFDKVKTLSLAF